MTCLRFELFGHRNTRKMNKLNKVSDTKFSK